VRKLETGHLDFQRLSFDHEGLHLYEAGTKRRWINVESAGEQQREFLFNLDDGLYKVEFRLIGTPMFGRRLALTRAITYPVFHLSRASQWVATAVIATGRKAAIKPLRDEGEGPPRNGKI
jgi:hypothetical protein